jgi:predicted nuclease with TOPRIM domain
MQAARRLQRDHAVLKARFAEVEVERTILSSENQQLIQELRAAQHTIEKLTAEIVKLTPKDKAKPDAEPDPRQPAEK